MLRNSQAAVAGIAARECLTAKRSRPEMAPQRLEKIESAPGNGMGSEASNPQHLVHGRATDHARLRLTNRKNDKVGKLQSCRKRVIGAKVGAVWATLGRVRWRCVRDWVFLVSLERPGARLDRARNGVGSWREV